MKLSEESESAGLQRALERSKEILNHVNAAVKEAADYHRLADIQRRLDRGPFEKTDHNSVNDFKVSIYLLPDGRQFSSKLLLKIIKLL